MPSSLEKKFTLYWQGLKGPELVTEARLIPARRWRCDFWHVDSNTVIELEGFGKGHQGIAKFILDAEKYLALTLEGYVVIRLTAKQITVPVLESLIRFVAKKGNRP